MNDYYLDTNILLHITDSSASKHEECMKFISWAIKEKIKLITSYETIQEIIHVTKKSHKPLQGFRIVDKTFKLIDEFKEVNISVINEYLKLAKKYTKLDSRDCLHLATCIVSRIPILITYDKKLLSTEELQVITPKKI